MQTLLNNLTKGLKTAAHSLYILLPDLNSNKRFLLYTRAYWLWWEADSDSECRVKVSTNPNGKILINESLYTCILQKENRL